MPYGTSWNWNKAGLVANRFDLPDRVVEGLAEIRIGMGSCCIANGSADVRAALAEAVKDFGAPAVVKPVGCVGMCHQTPMVEIVGAGRTNATYVKVDPADARRIVRRHFKPKGMLRKIKSAVSSAVDGLLTDETWEPVTRYAIDTRDAPVCAFLGRQQHIATELCGRVDPLDMDEYISHGGFEALARCVTQSTPESVIENRHPIRPAGPGWGGFSNGPEMALTRWPPTKSNT